VCLWVLLRTTVLLWSVPEIARIARRPPRAPGREETGEPETPVAASREADRATDRKWLASVEK
jgi:hypothetical protein